MSALSKIFGSHSERELKRIYPIADKVESYKEAMGKLSDEELKDKTREFKKRLEDGATLDDILPEAFATVREAAKRVLGMEHYRVQIIGGIILHQGRIAEMRTGEGKTLVSTLPAYLNALEGKGVCIVTVNDYLAKRDAEWMGQVHEFLGLKVGVVLGGMDNDERREAYGCDITYITNNELGFDYLRDNMVIYKEQLVQRGLHYAIIDEVDSVLIDEARTPLIISGQSGKSTRLYEACDILATQMKRGEDVPEYSKMDAIMGIVQDETGDFIVNEKDKVVNLTQDGVKKVEQFFHIENLADPENLEIQHNIILALRAHNLMFKDQDYVVKDDEVLIVDEFTGRIMPGRRYSDGLHQAIEAKEHVKVKRESKTLATITFQNFFNKFDKKAGMTGTALTEEKEFRDIYGMDVVEIPTNKPVARIDLQDAVYATKKEKFKAVVDAVKEAHEKGQPVLVGTITIETSELLSGMLKREGIPHTVLNAKFHEKEAEIVALAGQHGAVTIATNMAGRGTDIMLGGNAETLALDDLKRGLIKLAESKVQEGELDERTAKMFVDKMVYEANGHAETDNPGILAVRKKFDELYKLHKAQTDADAEKVRAAGGLYILGTERHESRRIDNQLRGRAGRQGDPGETRFYLSLEDDLLRLFGGERITNLMDRLNLDEDTPIENKTLSKAIENAQTSVESRNFQYRKSTLEYDDVMNKQREIIYGQRKQVLDGMDIKPTVLNMLRSSIASKVTLAFSDQDKSEDELRAEALRSCEGTYFPRGAVDASSLSGLSADELTDRFYAAAESYYEAKEAALTSPIMRELERVVLLRVVDEYWMDHIDAMSELRQAIRLQSYGNNKPIDVYKQESLTMFEDMISAIQGDTVRRIFSARVKTQNEVKRERVADGMVASTSGDGTVKKQPRKVQKIGRNDPCPCGSGKKYKQCCGR